MIKRIALSLLQVLLFAAVIFGIYYGIRKGYSFGEAVFNETTGDQENPYSTTITVTEEDDISSVANLLFEKGLITDRGVFVVQQVFYSREIVPGTYLVNSNMTGKDLLDVLSGSVIVPEG